MEISVTTVARVIEMGHELDRSEAELRAFIDDMNDDEKAELTAIYWIGRGSFEPDDWGEAVDTALTEASTPTADYLLGSPHFADHIEAGVEALGLDVSEDADDQP